MAFTKDFWEKNRIELKRKLSLGAKRRIVHGHTGIKLTGY